MKRKHLSPVLFALLGLSTLILFSPEGWSQPPGGSPPEATGAGKVENPVALVNETKIYERDLTMMIREMRRQFGEKSIAAEPADVLRRKAFDQYLAVELLYQDSRDLGLTDVEQQVDSMLAMAEKQAGSKEQFEAQLEKEGLDRRLARENIKKNVVLQANINKKVIPSITVSEEELQAAYQATPDRFKHGDQVGARHILIRIPKEAGDDQKKTAKLKIASIRQEILAGKDFAETAKTQSDCPSKARGGDLGYFAKGRMVPEFEKAAFSLKEGEVSEIVETQFGFHLIQVYGKKPAGVTPLSEVRGSLEREIKNKKTNEAVGAYVKDLRKKAKIEILDQTLSEK
jgi:peptidyl-prolyl cis-trans isomerase C